MEVDPGESPGPEPTYAAWDVCQEQRREHDSELWAVRGWLWGRGTEVG